MAATHPIPVGAPIRLTRNTSAIRSAPRINPISVGSMYTTASARKRRTQNA